MGHKTQIIVTDLTRFAKDNKVCLAGISANGVVVRPLPYLTVDECKSLRIRPMTILEDEFRTIGNPAPHSEDAFRRSMKVVRTATSEELRHVLEQTTFSTVSAGFGVQLEQDQKCIPTNSAISRSLVTVKLPPRNFSVVEGHDQKLKAHLTDNGGLSFRFLSITDLLCFQHLSSQPDLTLAIDSLNRHIQAQLQLYLRVGIGRPWKNEKDGREGYWIQINGIYTFPTRLQFE